MGFSFSDWAEVTGAMYQGFGGSMPLVWTLIALGLCIGALVIGGMKEASSYKK